MKEKFLSILSFRSVVSNDLTELYKYKQYYIVEIAFYTRMLTLIQKKAFTVFVFRHLVRGVVSIFPHTVDAIN